MIIGPDHDGSAARIVRRPNVHVLGERPYVELARYARRFDVAIIPFEVSEITRSTSPVKLFEYMAAGAPVVATPMDECRKYRAVSIAEGPEAFLAAVRAAVGRRDDPAHQALLAREVRENTWASRVDAILARLPAGGGRPARRGGGAVSLPAPNSPAYWDARFASGDWEGQGGPEQTRFFARVALSAVPAEVRADILARRATVCDWGCAEGDATRIIGERWRVPVSGVDAAPAAIERARARHPGLEFTCRSDGLDRDCDVLFTSNTLEHFAAPWEVLARLLPRVRRYALVLVPFEEDPRIPEHACTFRSESFPLRLGAFELVGLEVVDCARLEGSRWPGRQALAVYAHAGTGAAARGDARGIVGSALALAAAAEARAAAAEARLARAAEGLCALRAELDARARELDLAHGRRWYGRRARRPGGAIARAPRRPPPRAGWWAARPGARRR